MNLRYFLAYLNERFPFVNMGLFAILFGTVFSMVHLHDADHSFGIREVGGILVVISFFFRLRVFDEIKDYQIDSINHPNRVLQSGKINLKTLIVLTTIGFVAEVAWSYWMGSSALIAYAVAFTFSLLMRYEFFVGDWLKKRLVVYAISHMLIMPLIIGWIWFSYEDDVSFLLLLLIGLSLLAGFSFEIARKIHDSVSEVETIDSYSRTLGLKNAIFLILALVLVGILNQSYLLYLISSSVWSYVLLIILYLFLLVYYIKQLKAPSEKQLRKLELGVSLFMLISYVSIIIECNL